MIINSRVFGKSENKLIILHGFLGSLDNWITIAKKISDLGFEDSAAVSSNADDPEGGGSEVPTQTTVAEPTVTQQQVDTIAQMPIDNPQQITAFGQAIRDNAELYNMLTAEEKTAVDALIGGQ